MWNDHWGQQENPSICLSTMMPLLVPWLIVCVNLFAHAFIGHAIWLGRFCWNVDRFDSGSQQESTMKATPHASSVFYLDCRRAMHMWHVARSVAWHALRIVVYVYSLFWSAIFVHISIAALLLTFSVCYLLFLFVTRLFPPLSLFASFYLYIPFDSFLLSFRPFVRSSVVHLFFICSLFVKCESNKGLPHLDVSLSKLSIKRVEDTFQAALVHLRNRPGTDCPQQQSATLLCALHVWSTSDFRLFVFSVQESTCIFVFSSVFGVRSSVQVPGSNTNRVSRSR